MAIPVNILSVCGSGTVTSSMVASKQLSLRIFHCQHDHQAYHHILIICAHMVKMYWLIQHPYSKAGFVHMVTISMRHGKIYALQIYTCGIIPLPFLKSLYIAFLAVALSD